MLTVAVKRASLTRAPATGSSRTTLNATLARSGRARTRLPEHSAQCRSCAGRVRGPGLRRKCGNLRAGRPSQLTNPVNELGKLFVRHAVRPSLALSHYQVSIRIGQCDVELVRRVPELDRNSNAVACTGFEWPQAADSLQEQITALDLVFRAKPVASPAGTTDFDPGCCTGCCTTSVRSP